MKSCNLRQLVVIRGAGDLASGIALRLSHAGFSVVMREKAQPLAVRRTVSFSEAVRLGRTQVEDVEAVLTGSPGEASAAAGEGKVAVLVDPEGSCISRLRPAAVVNAIMAKTRGGDCAEGCPGHDRCGSRVYGGEKLSCRC